MVQEMDQGAIEGAMDGESDGSGSEKERWKVRALDQGPISS